MSTYESPVDRRYREAVAAMDLLAPRLDALAAERESVWTVICGDYGHHPYPLGPMLVERPCNCRTCRGFQLCQRVLAARRISVYSSRAVAQSVGTRMGDMDGFWYLAVPLPQRVLDTTSALLVAGAGSQQAAFKAAVLLSG